MPRDTFGNLTIQSLRKEGFIKFDAEKFGAYVTIVGGDEGATAKVSISSLINITSYGIDIAVAGLNPNEKQDKVVQAVAALDLSEDDLIAALRRVRAAQSPEAKNENTLPGTEPNADDAKTSDETQTADDEKGIAHTDETAETATTGNGDTEPTGQGEPKPGVVVVDKGAIPPAPDEDDTAYKSMQETPAPKRGRK